MAYTGHETCAINNGVHKDHPTLGVANRGVGYMIINNFNSEASELKTVVHEFGHMFEVQDHYEIGDVPSTDEMNEMVGYALYSSTCIYGEDKETSAVLSGLIICNGCKQTIEANRTKYNHGNEMN